MSKMRWDKVRQDNNINRYGSDQIAFSKHELTARSISDLSKITAGGDPSCIGEDPCNKGDPCGVCQTPLVLCRHKKKGWVPRSNQKYYYKKWLKCLIRGQTYFLKKDRVYL